MNIFKRIISFFICPPNFQPEREESVLKPGESRDIKLIEILGMKFYFEKKP